MAQVSDLPCDGEGMCMVCKAKPSERERLTCKTCVTLWYAACLSGPLETLAAAVKWKCPDCTSLGGGTSEAGCGGDGVSNRVRSEPDGPGEGEEAAGAARGRDKRWRGDSKRWRGFGSDER